jgi:hypothetical protein
MKRLIALLFVFISADLFAPGMTELPIGVGVPLNPFEKQWYATIKVELQGKPDTTINRDEWAYGPGQVREVRLTDYNRRTGSHYTLEDCLDRAVARKIYMYYAGKYDPTDLETVARAWNGSGPKTDEYWRKIQKAMDNGNRR